VSEDQKEAGWNILRACFWLLSSIIWAQIIFSFSVFAVCAAGVWTGHIPIGSCKEYAPDMMELLVGGMAVVIAFSGRAK
jgi:hypothetical protein